MRLLLRHLPPLDQQCLGAAAVAFILQLLPKLLVLQHQCRHAALHGPQRHQRLHHHLGAQRPGQHHDAMVPHPIHRLVVGLCLYQKQNPHGGPLIRNVDGTLHAQLIRQGRINNENIRHLPGQCLLYLRHRGLELVLAEAGRHDASDLDRNLLRLCSNHNAAFSIRSLH